jgi:plasmid stability protein
MREGRIHTAINPSTGMTLTLSLPPDMEQKLRERAALVGQTLEGFVRQLLEREVQEGNGTRATPTAALDEILRPVHEEFQRSDMTEEELTRFLTEVRDEVRREKRTGKAP